MKKFKQACLLLCTLIVVCLAMSVSTYAADKKVSGDWEYTISSNGATITAYNGNSKIIDIPSSIGGYSVVGIGSRVFQDSKMTGLTIPETVTNIGYNAFYNCKNLSKIYFNATTLQLL